MSDETLTLRDPADRGFDVRLIEEDRDGNLTVRADDGRRMFLPAAAIARRDGARVDLALPLADLEGARDGAEEEVRVPIVEERAEVTTRERPGAAVRVTTRTDEVEETIDRVLEHEAVDVERVPIGRRVDEPASVREEGDTTIVPLHEEVLVVEKRLVLREELRLTKRRETRTETRDVRLRKQHADIERDDDPDGA